MTAPRRGPPYATRPRRAPGSASPAIPALPVVLTLLLLPLTAGCASSAGPEGSSSDPYLITAEELQDWRGRHLGEAIQSLRPRWLRSRGNTSIRLGEEIPRVVLDGAIVGEAEELERISVESVEEVRFLDARDATTRYGTGFGGGAIVVVTR